MNKQIRCLMRLSEAGSQAIEAQAGRGVGGRKRTTSGLLPASLAVPLLCVRRLLLEEDRPAEQIKPKTFSQSLILNKN